MISYFLQKKIEKEAEKNGKKVMIATTGIVLAGVGTFLAYKAIKKRIGYVEQELEYLNDEDVDECPYCDRIYEVGEEDREELKEKVDEFNSRRISSENCNDSTPEEMEHYLNNIKEDKNNINVDSTAYAEGDYEKYNYFEDKE